MELDEFFKELNDRLGGLCFREEVFEDWLTTRHEQFFQLQDWEEVRYRGEQRGEWWTEISGKVRNRGQSGGMVAVKGSLFHLDRTRKRSEIESKMYSTYLKAGEAKEFRFVSKGKSSGFSLNLGLAANRPMNLSLPAENRDGGMPGELSGSWTRIDPVVFEELPGVWVVDDQDVGFSFEDGKRKSLLQRWFGKKDKMRYKNYLEDYWTYSYDAEAYGDSLRTVCSKKVGDGSSTALWRVSLPEAGRYEIKAHVLRCESNGMIPPEPALNIVYHYTVAWDGGEEEVEVLLDVLEGKWRGWVSLGVFDLPAGESRVILSDKGEKGRERLGIVADAVKWEKQEE